MSEERTPPNLEPRATPRTALRATSAVRLLVAEPELGESLSADEFEQARRQIVLPVIDVEPGTLEPEDLRQIQGLRGDLYGFLMLSGTLIIKLRMSGRECGRLVSTGGLVLVDEAGSESIPIELKWVALDECRLACLDTRLLDAVQRWPLLMTAILRRAAQHARHALMQQAISQLPKVEDRLLALFWSLADRQGVVRPDGIWVELPVTHDTLAHLVGAQRPTVSLGLARLAESGLLHSHPGGWLINPGSIEALSTRETDLEGEVET